MRKTLTIIIISALAFLLVSCNSDSDTSTDGDSEAVETDGDAEAEAETDSADGDAELDAAESETESDADIKQPVPHGREVLPERVPGGACPGYTQSKPVTYEGAPQDADCAINPEGDQCNYDSDCEGSANGFCYPGFGWPRSPCSEDDDKNFCVCHYHLCIEDSDCPEHKACICRDGITGICADSCRSSAECGEGHRCVETEPYGEINKSYGNYRCTSERDECASDWDCPEEQRCMFDMRKKIIFTCIDWYDGCG